MKIAHVIDSGGLYGAEHMLLCLCDAQIKLGLDVCVLSIGKIGEPEKPLEKCLKVRGIEVISWRMSALPNLFETRRILKHLISLGVDILHSHGYKGNILFGILPLAIRKIPCVTTMHGFTKHPFFSRMTVYQFLDKLFSSRLERRILVSPIMTKFFKLSKKTVIIENGLPPLVDRAARLKNQQDFFSNMNTDDFKIGSLGRLCEEKNFKLLIGAMPLILATIPNAKLIIFGEGSDRAELIELIVSLGLQDKVSLPGYLQDTQSFFAGIDVYVNCSTTEGMPMSIIEAMRQGTHIVATKIPANIYLLQHLNVLHQLCELNERSLADSIEYLFFADAIQKNELKTAYINNFNDKHLASVMAKKYLNIYTALKSL